MNIRTFLTHHKHALTNSLMMLKDAPLVTFLTFTVIAVALTLPALFGLLTLNMKHLVNSWQQGQHVSLYLKPGLSPSLQHEVLSHVRETDGVRQAVLVSPEEGLNILQAQEGLSDVAAYLENNPLPPVIEVIPDTALDTPEKLREWAKMLKTHDHVEQFKLDMQWVEKLYAILGFLSTLAKSLMILLGFAVIMIIGSTLRLAVERRYEEIQVLKLIGATDQYIARPFLYSGLWYGLGGSLLALVLVVLFLSSLASVLNELMTLYQIKLSAFSCSFVEVVGFVLFAVFLSFIGAYLSIKRQLSLIEP